MRELRTCPVTGVVVLLNDAWPDRPAPAPSDRAPCWFCTPTTPVIASRGRASTRPHPVPALGIEGNARPLASASGVRREAVGAHELIAGAHDGEAGLLLFAAERMADLRRDTRLRGFRLLRDARPGAHVVWQLFAIPTDVAPGEAAAWRAAELAAGVRVVARAGGATAIAAFAPRVPFELWVLPDGDAEFPVASDAVERLADRLVHALAVGLGGAPVRLVVEFGAPWRIVVRPVTTPTLPTAAVDLPGHGVFPERAAAELRRWLADTGEAA